MCKFFFMLTILLDIILIHFYFKNSFVYYHAI